MSLRSMALAAALAAGLGTAAWAGSAPPAKDVIPELQDTVLNGLTKARVEALQALGGISDEERLSLFKVPEFLLGVLKDSGNNARTRGAAADALARVIRYVPAFADKVLISLVERLQDGNESLYVRLKIAEAMGGFLQAEAVGHRTALQALTKIARDPGEQPGLVAAALRALGRTGYGDALQAVIDGIRHRDQQVQAAALAALKGLFAKIRVNRSEDVVRQLMAIVSDAKVPPEVRVEAMSALVSTMNQGVKASQVAGALVAVLEGTKDPELAAAVVEALARVPEESSVAALKKAYTTFSNPHNAKGYLEVRAKIAETLGEYFHPLAKQNRIAAGQSVAELLMHIAKKGEPSGVDQAARAAVYALGNMTSPLYNRAAVVDDLIEAMDKDQAVAKTAHQSLVLITGRDEGADSKKWREWFKKNRGTLNRR